MPSGKGILLLCGSIFFLVVFIVFQGTEVLSLWSLKNHLTTLQNTVALKPFQSMGAFFILSVFVTAASLPGAAVLALSAGALFGMIKGVLLCSFASSLGATFAFLGARYLFRDGVIARYPERMKRVDEEFEQGGLWYLLSLRLVPFVPFFLVNILMGLTPIRLSVFYGVSQLGMLPGAILYVNAGVHLAGINAVSDIMTMNIMLSFLAVAVIPLMLRGILKRRVRGMES